MVVGGRVSGVRVRVHCDCGDGGMERGKGGKGGGEERSGAVEWEK